MPDGEPSPERGLQRGPTPQQPEQPHAVMGRRTPAQKRRTLRIGLWVLLGIILVGCGVGFWYSNAVVSGMVWQRVPPSKATPADYGLTAENVELRSSDGLRISAWFVPAKVGATPAGRPRGTVILVHGLGGNMGTKGDLLPHAKLLVDNGYNAMPLDLRAHGNSGGNKITYGWNEAKDVLAAIHYLQKRPDTAGGKIALMGLSMGADTVIIAAAQANTPREVGEPSASSSTAESTASGSASGARPVAAVIANSGFVFTEEVQNTLRTMGMPVWLTYPMVDLAYRIHMGAWVEQVSAEKAVAQLRNTPLFILHGTKDPEVSVDQAHKLYAQARGPRELWIVPGASHCIIDTPNDVTRAQNGEYARRILSFLQKYMGA